MEIVTTIAGKIAEHMVEPVGRWLCYSFQYGSNIENLKNRVEELEGLREIVQHDVAAALNNCEEIFAYVHQWLTKVDEINKEAREVLREAEKPKLKSSEKCMNLKPRHILSWKANKIMRKIAEDQILEKGKFEKVSYHPIPQEIVALPFKGYMSFKSRESTMVQLMEALKDDNVNVIGVRGMGGIGKTTLVSEVCRQAKEEKLFNQVAMVDVTPSLDIKKIQKEIMELLHLKFDEETVPGRAGRLLDRLAKDKRILVVLDNIWKPLDLEKIGIPRKGCKVVLISRILDVLSKMETEKDFGIEVLPKDEAWNLFSKMVGDSFNAPRILDIAGKVANKCAGLPIALVAVSKALKNKSFYEWKDALRRLEKSTPEHDTEMESTIYSCIELSYSQLETEVKVFFLHCAQIGNIVFHISFLSYCYGLGLFSGIDTLEEARNNIYRLVWYLKNRDLLQDCQYINCYREWEHYHMHDVVCSVGRLIASKDHNMIGVKGCDGQEVWPKLDVLKRCETLVIRGDINEVPSEIEFPELRFFVVVGRLGSLQISDTFFEGMQKLKVMDLTSVKLSTLPSSLPNLTSLKTLCLDYCKLKDITIIGELESLTSLSLMGSNISKLPQELRRLTRLVLLNLSYCSKLEVIPPGVLSKLVKLEDLYVRGTSIQWQAIPRDNASLAELNYLSELVTLEIHVQDVNHLPRDLSLVNLERYKIFIGDVWDQFDEYETSKTLKLQMNTSIDLEAEIKKLLRITESLYLDELKDINSVVHELDSEGFKHLKHLQIQNNSKIKYMINSKSGVIAFPTLETLLLKNMISLEELCHSKLASKSFQNLRSIKIEQCDNVKFLILSSMVSCLSKLENLEISECSNMVAIITKEGGEIEGEHTTWFPKLRCLRLHCLPKLMGFLSVRNSFTTDAGEIMLLGKLDCYSQILQEEVVFPKLEELELSSLYGEDVQHKRQLARSSCRFTSTPTTSRLQNLLSLIVRGSGNAKHLWSFSTAKSMVQLKFLEIRECSVIEEILLTEDLGVEEETIPKTLFPQLETLHLRDLPIIKWFCEGINIEFSSLKKLKIQGCPKFMTFICKLDGLGMTAGKELKGMSANESLDALMEPFFNDMVGFPKLEELNISGIVDLKRIWHDQFVENSFSKLQVLVIKSCENLTSVFQCHVLVRFQGLSYLEVRDCNSVQEVFELHGLNVEEMNVAIAIQLKVLSLTGLPKMRHVWNKDPHPFFTFQDLKEVHVWRCESLKSLFTASVARSLTQLEILSMVDCGVEEIVTREDVTQAIDKLVFPRVTHLYLRKLPRLEQFHPGVYTAELPELKRTLVQGCPFDPALSSFGEALEDGHHETSKKKIYFLVDKAQAKCVDSFPEFIEDLAISDSGRFTGGLSR